MMYDALTNKQYTYSFYSSSFIFTYPTNPSEK